MEQIAENLSNNRFLMLCLCCNEGHCSGSIICLFSALGAFHKVHNLHRPFNYNIGHKSLIEEHSNI
jgi:hypothetical protein